MSERAEFSLQPVRVKAAGGFKVHKGSRGKVRFTRDAVALVGTHVLRGMAAPDGTVTESERELVVIPYRAVVHFLIEDRKGLQKAMGPSYLGGGFGLKGAAEGMLMASALQSLSGAFTRRGTIIGVESADGFFIVEHMGSDVWAVRRSVRAVREGEVPETPSQTAEPRRSTSDSATLPDQLERLSALHRQGMLSAQEFERAKARLLDT